MPVRPTEIVSVIVAAIACAGAIISALYTYTSRNRELDIELVKVGIGILRADPKETQTQGAREWAIEVIETNSGQKFSAEAKKELLQNKLDFQPYARDFDPYAGGYDPFAVPGQRQRRPSPPQSK
jgi:hypothetical protein